MAIKDPQYSSSAQPCGSGQQVVYAWALNAPELELPDNVGFRVGGPDSEIDWLVLQVSNFASYIHMQILRIVQVILFEMDCASFNTNFHELFCQFISKLNKLGKFW